MTPCNMRDDCHAHPDVGRAWRLYRRRWRRQWLGARRVDERVPRMALGFAVNVPIGLIALVITPWLVPADRKETQTSRLDLGGALATTAGLALLVCGLTSAGDRSPAQLSSWLPLLSLLFPAVNLAVIAGSLLGPGCSFGWVGGAPCWLASPASRWASLADNPACRRSACSSAAGGLHPDRRRPGRRVGRLDPDRTTDAQTRPLAAWLRA